MPANVGAELCLGLNIVAMCLPLEVEAPQAEASHEVPDLASTASDGADDPASQAPHLVGCELGTEASTGGMGHATRGRTAVCRNRQAYTTG